MSESGYNDPRPPFEGGRPHQAEDEPMGSYTEEEIVPTLEVETAEQRDGDSNWDDDIDPSDISTAKVYGQLLWPSLEPVKKKAKELDQFVKRIPVTRDYLKLEEESLEDAESMLSLVSKYEAHHDGAIKRETGQAHDERASKRLSPPRELGPGLSDGQPLVGAPSHPEATSFGQPSPYNPLLVGLASPDFQPPVSQLGASGSSALWQPPINQHANSSSLWVPPVSQPANASSSSLRLSPIDQLGGSGLSSYSQPIVGPPGVPDVSPYSQPAVGQPGNAGSSSFSLPNRTSRVHPQSAAASTSFNPSDSLYNIPETATPATSPRAPPAPSSSMALQETPTHRPAGRHDHMMVDADTSLDDGAALQTPQPTASSASAKSSKKMGKKPAPEVPEAVPFFAWDEATGSWRHPMHLNQDTKIAMAEHIREMTSSKYQRLYRYAVDRQQAEIAHIKHSCFGCQVIERDRSMCGNVASDNFACFKCVSTGKQPCGKLIDDPDRAGKYAIGFLPLPSQHRGHSVWEQKAFWLLSPEQAKALRKASKTPAKKKSVSSMIEGVRKSLRGKTGGAGTGDVAMADATAGGA